jgi:hypothetical protein
MQSKLPLTPALSPSNGAREKLAHLRMQSLNGTLTRDSTRNSLSPSDGERVRVRRSVPLNSPG